MNTSRTTITRTEVPSSARSRGSAPAGGPRRPRGGQGFPWLKAFATLVAIGCLGMAALIGGVLIYYSSKVPDFRALADYKPPLITKVFDRNGEVVAEFARERRIWLPIDQIPQEVIRSFLAAEDADFYKHGGFDLKAIARAAIMNTLTDRMQGASTITQQVAKTFLLSSERTYTRKIKELILSWRIEKAFSKNEILELYLNRIYLGNGSYGVAAAAQTYFNKTLPELTLPERAMIAGLPQAPSRFNPVRNPSAAKARRDIIIRRMEAEGFVPRSEADAAVASALVLNLSPLKQGADAPHFAEYIRRQIEQEYGTDALYDDGLTVYTTIDLDLQKRAELAVYEGLKAYDRRHGWRGAMTKLESMANWEDQMVDMDEQYKHSVRIGYPAVVLEVKDKSLEVGLAGGQRGTVAASGWKWTGKGSGKNVAKKGDVIMVKPLPAAEGSTARNYSLEQIPQAQSALTALDVRSGEVLAMVGGLGEGIGFNRAVQAKRQPGSSFKPIVYAAALEKGYTPATTILDAPVVFNDNGKEWKPSNYDNKIGGPTTLREGLEKSKNLMTVRLGQDIGLRAVADLAKRMGIKDRVPITDLSVLLGTVSFDLLEMTAAYAVFPRGGIYVPPTVISRIQNSKGETLRRARTACDDCLASNGATPDKLPTPPATTASLAMSPQIAYQMVSMLQGVVQRGTGASIASLKRPLAGKTGTTNDYIDAWFVGFSPSMSVGVWVGMDTPKSLGYGETGGRAALPIWKAFMGSALAERPVEDFPVPDGLEFVRIDRKTGMLPGESTTQTLNEAFLPGTAPTSSTPAPTDDGMGGGAIEGIFNAFGIY